LDAATFPLLSANIDPATEPTMIGKFRKSVIVEVGGRRVGIIGYTTVETTVRPNHT
jgi:5'-nucleotidase